MRLAARINYAQQYSPDDFHSLCHIKEITKDTTIGELIEWQKGKFPHHKELHEGKDINQMHISTME